jgi:hypothetical protein
MDGTWLITGAATGEVINAFTSAGPGTGTMLAGLARIGAGSKADDEVKTGTAGPKGINRG